MDNITIDRVIWWSGADAASGDTTRCHLMSYSIDSGNGSTSGDFSSGAVLADGGDVTNAGYEQAYYQQKGIDCCFAGGNSDNSFDYGSSDYLGSWDHQQVCDNLIKFSNLILLSSSELQPLVCLEGLAAGLGLVISSPSAQSLDITKPWIDVIPDDRLEDIDYINDVIKNNRVVSDKHRSDIVEYSKEFEGGINALDPDINRKR